MSPSAYLMNESTTVMMKKVSLIVVTILLINILSLETLGEEQQEWGELTNLAYMYFEAGQYQTALKLTKESLALSGYKDDALSLANLAAIYKTISDTVSANKILQQIKLKRIELEKELTKEEKLYEKMKRDARIRSLRPGPITEKFFDLVTLRKGINFYNMYENNAKRGTVVHSMFGASRVAEPVTGLHLKEGLRKDEIDVTEGLFGGIPKELLDPPPKPPKENIEKIYYDSGKLWKIYIYRDNSLIGLKEFDKQGNLILDEEISY